MKRKILAIAAASFVAVCIISCGGNATEKKDTTTAPESMVSENKADPSTYDPKRGEGEYSESNVTLGALDQALATKGEEIVGTKCSSCHKLTEEKLVGPGWKGVTERRKAHWIMNFITNPDPMIDKDPEVQAQLELCLVRMPNQNLTGDDARAVLEYMRKNDGVK